ncbi:MAG: NnrU family protein [Pseudomonadota bacterium]
MDLLIAGVALWWAAHLFKRVAPSMRARLGAQPGRGVVTLLLLLSVALMYLGYREAGWTEVYLPPDWGRHLNNFLMLIAVILFGMGSSKGRMRRWLRHPMLTGFAVWAVAHLLVRGDLASVILFGALGLWALVELPVIAHRERSWQRPAAGPLIGDVRLILVSLIVYAGIVTVHWQLFGLYPFAG